MTAQPVSGAQPFGMLNSQNGKAPAGHAQPKVASGKATSGDQVLENIDSYVQNTLPGTQLELLVRDAKATCKLTMQAFKGIGSAFSDAWDKQDKWFIKFSKVFGAGVGALLCGGGLLVSVIAKVSWVPTLYLSSLWGILQAGKDFYNTKEKSLQTLREGYSRGFDEAFEKTEWINNFLQTVGAIVTAPLAFLEVLGNRLIHYCADPATSPKTIEKREKIEYAIYHLEPTTTPNVFIHALHKARKAGKVNFDQLNKELTTLKELGVNFGAREFGSLITVLSFGTNIGTLPGTKEQEATTNMQELAKIITKLKVTDQLNRQNKILLQLDKKAS